MAARRGGIGLLYRALRDLQRTCRKSLSSRMLLVRAGPEGLVMGQAEKMEEEAAGEMEEKH